eukprot:SAG11_NODE_30920_length_296_cov_1.025381_1_plen_53_part_01
MPHGGSDPCDHAFWRACGIAAAVSTNERPTPAVDWRGKESPKRIYIQQDVLAP